MNLIEKYKNFRLRFTGVSSDMCFFLLYTKTFVTFIYNSGIMEDINIRDYDEFNKFIAFLY